MYKTSQKKNESITRLAKVWKALFGIKEGARSRFNTSA